MTAPDVHRLLVWVIFGLAGATFLYLLRTPAPYGRHYPGHGWGPTVSSTAGSRFASIRSPIWPPGLAAITAGTWNASRTTRPTGMPSSRECSE